MNIPKLFFRFKNPSDYGEGVREIICFQQNGNDTIVVYSTIEDNDAFLNVMKNENLSRQECVEKYGTNNTYKYGGKIFTTDISNIYLVNPIDKGNGIMDYSAAANIIE